MYQELVPPGGCAELARFVGLESTTYELLELKGSGWRGFEDEKDD